MLIYLPFEVNDSFPKLGITCNDVLLTRINSLKCLGIIIDSKLNFQPHVRMIESKLARSVEILSEVRFLYSPAILILLYFALMQLHLLFGIVLTVAVGFHLLLLPFKTSKFTE